MPASRAARQSGSSSPKEVTPGRSRPGQMMRAPYYDRDGRPVSQREWRQLGRRPGYSRVGYADAVRPDPPRRHRDPRRPGGASWPRDEDAVIGGLGRSASRHTADNHGTRHRHSQPVHPAGPLPPGCIGQVMLGAWVDSAGTG
jgi:hypothetical protein